MFGMDVETHIAIATYLLFFGTGFNTVLVAIASSIELYKLVKIDKKLNFITRLLIHHRRKVYAKRIAPKLRAQAKRHSLMLSDSEKVRRMAMRLAAEKAQRESVNAGSARYRTKSLPATWYVVDTAEGSVQ